MKKKYENIIKYAYFLSLVFIFSLATVSYLFQKQYIVADEIFKSESLDAFVNEFYPWAITVSSGLAVIMLIYSGYLYVTSAGNTEQITKAKDYISSALFGLAFLILASLIFKTIGV